MKSVRGWCLAAVVVVLAVPAVRAQEPPKPGPEHDQLKKYVGTWDLTMKFEGGESKGTCVYTMELGGLWLASTVESDLMGMKFTGKGFDTFDATKKKFVGVWVDSMSTGPMIMEGTYDSAKKTLTMAGEGPGMDGKPTKYKSTSEMPDDDLIIMKMWMGDAKEPSFTITYKRKK